MDCLGCSKEGGRTAAFPRLRLPGLLLERRQWGGGRDAFKGSGLQNWLNGFTICQGGETARGTGLEMEVKCVSSTSGLNCQWILVLSLHPEFSGEVEGGDTSWGALGLGWDLRPGP